MRATGNQPDPTNRLNVLLSGRDEAWSLQLPRLLEPQGVRAIRAGSVDAAVRIIESEPIHAVVVDLALPTDLTPAPGMGSHATEAAMSGGLKLLRVIRRLHPTPPAVVVRDRRFDTRTDNRVLAEALRLDVFSVLDEPVQIDQLLDALRRLLQRHYGGHWPGT